MIRTLDEMALIAGCYDLDAELRYIADSPAPEHGGFHPRVVAAARGAINVIAEARAEVAALRADAAKLSELLDAEENKAINLAIKLTRASEVTALVREWQAAKRNLRAELLDPTHRGRVTSREESNERGLAIKAVTEAEARLLAAALPEVVK